MADVLCPKCDKRNVADAKFCSNCGAKIPRLENLPQDMVEQMAQFGRKYQTLIEEWLEPQFKGFLFTPRLMAPFDFMEAVKFWGMFAPVYKNRLFEFNRLQNEETPRKMVQLYNDMIQSLFTDTLKGAQNDVVNKYKVSQEEIEKFVAEAKAVSDEAKVILEDILDMEQEIQQTMVKMPKDFVEQAFAGMKNITEKLIQAPVLSVAELGSGWLAYQEQFKNLVINFTTLWQKYAELRMQSGAKLFELHKRVLHDTFQNKFTVLLNNINEQNYKMLDCGRMDQLMASMQERTIQWQNEMSKTCNFFLK